MKEVQYPKARDSDIWASVKNFQEKNIVSVMCPSNNLNCEKLAEMY